MIINVVALALIPLALAAPAPVAADDSRLIVTLRGSTNRGEFMRTVRGRFTGRDAFRHTYKTALSGFSGSFSSETAAFLRSSAQVEAVEEDGVMSISDIQADATWGLQCITQQSKLADTDPFALTYDYPFAAPAGAGAIVYVVDTGIRATHEDFGGRAKMAAQFGGYALTDGNGHGTHCAGTIGGTSFGVAKNVQIRGIKVLSDTGSGSTSDVIAGIDYAVSQFRTNYLPSVISLSLGGSFSSATNAAIERAVAAGVHCAVAAGNSNVDACTASPASAARAITVGALNILDERAFYSNYGKCVDIFAPGSNVTSAWFGSDTQTRTISGTSMATPHTAGVMAYYLAQQNISTDAMATKLVSEASRGQINMAFDAAAVRNEAKSPTPNLMMFRS
uniref:Subtilisin-like serine protease n=1 Tax=Glaciozyma antarctica TaxID=105987 RepID=A0A386AGY4_9BASI|nr:subtilisin-like serine protease [Glaciozyma antarctica]